MSILKLTLLSILSRCNDLMHLGSAKPYAKPYRVKQSVDTLEKDVV